ncbi:HAMP domain-containing protein [Sphingobacterium puteale]|uniref:histidine kinase n=1 Tax=Sphingobacterium puteale TaxID=2420510 RepID=A0A420W083_9SPHI|nr:ATP-binding protein [Sphingobacterium puteale]RKO71829.1 HAMP domain-containing protein [Sphingobacterium puteale]
MKLKAKLTFGVGFLFFMILFLAVLSGWKINRLKQDTNNILVANYNTLHYSRNMLLALEQLHADLSGLELFAQNLKLQQQNMTENGEKEATARVSLHFSALQRQPSNLVLIADLRKDISQLMYLNMEAIEHKSKIADETAEKAILAISVAGAICFMIAFVLLINLPATIANPIAQLTESIQQIANGNYRRRLHFERNDEFGLVSQSFNTMAQKLEEYSESKLGKILAHKKRIEALIANMHDAVIGVDEEGKVLFANQQACLITGVKLIDFEGRKLQEIALSNNLVDCLTGKLSHGHRAKTNADPIKVFVNGRESYFEEEIIPINIIPTGESDFKFVGQFILLKNITTFKERDVAKTNFIGTVSHELKTPIASIRMGVQLLENEQIGALNDEQKELLVSIADDTDRLLRITGELLNTAQVESGAIQMKLIPVPVAPIVEYAVLANKSMAEQLGIHVDVQVAEDLPLIMADSEKAAWVLTNLLSNAIRYSNERASVSILVSKRESGVFISVQDTGQGIAPQYLAKIFERYFRIPGTNKEGTGLGLSISKEFIESMGGSMNVESEYGVGSTFSFFFPLA